MNPATATATTAGHAAHGHASDHHAAHSFWSKYIFSTDHKVIGLQYTLTGLAMAVFGVVLSMIFRMQLAFPGQPVPGFGVVSPTEYNAMITNHGTIMIFWVAMPVLLAGIGNYCIPLMVGCDDMVFPKVNRLSFQVFFVSALVLIASFLVPGGAFGGAWTSYPPLSANSAYNLTPWGDSLWLLAVALEIVAFLLGGINFIVTVMNSRAPGMTMFRIPILIWMLIIAVVLFMISVGPLVAGAVMLLLDQTIGTHFYDPARGGDPLLFQHLFWFFGHPEVYVLLLPVMGIVAEIFTVFARKKLFGTKAIIYTTFTIGILSMVVWAHHQFIAGIDPRMATIFSVTTIIISIPIALIIFAFIATLYGGSIRLASPMLWGLGMLVEFLLGGVTGIYLGSSALDVYFHDNYFVVAHFHYTLIPIVVFGGYAAVTYWFPKVTGRLLNEGLCKVHFWLTAIPFNFIFIPLFFTGMAGQHRRIWDYALFGDVNTPGLLKLNQVATCALIVMATVQLLFIANILISLRRGKVAGPNPWEANTLEWAAPSPPPHGNFAQMPVVYRGPYEYSVPGRESDYWPQHLPN